MRRKTLKRCAVYSSLVFSSLLPAMAAAQNLLLGGVQWGPQNSYSYLGGVLPVAGGQLGKGWFVTAFASYLTYQYRSGNPIEFVQTKVPGFNAGIGYAWKGASYAVALSGSVGDQYFSVAPHELPNAPSPQPEGNVPTFTPQIQARYNLSPQFYLSTIDSYSFGQSSYWSRFRGEYQPVWWLSVGPEGIIQGGQNYRIRQMGAFASFQLGQGWGTELEGGITYSSGLDNTGYCGFSFSKMF